MSDAREALAELQAAVDSRDVERLTSLFDESAAMIGTSGDGRDRDGVVRYLTEVVTQEDSLRWEWDDVVTFYDDGTTVGAAAFGEVVVTGPHGVARAPVRVSLVASREAEGWRIRHFHGSIPSSWAP